MGEINHLIKVLTGGDDDRAEEAALKLAALGSEVLPALKALLSSPQVEARWWAVRTLAEIQNSETPHLLISMLGDPDASVQQCAALGLRQQPHPAAVPALIRTLQSSDPELARLSGHALGAIGKPAVPSLIQVLESDRQAAQIEALRALAEIADPGSIPALMNALKKDSVLMEYWANQGLDNLGLGMSYFKT